MRRTAALIWLLVCLFVFLPALSQSDDITLAGAADPLFYLDQPFSETLLTSENETPVIEVSSAAVEKERILIRFYITGLSENWCSKITDENRLYGSYLPVAEIVLDSGTFLTPSSASRYSFLEYNGQLIIGGLLIFETQETPQAFYFNFNQIPFDTQPLSEGFTKAVILSQAVDQKAQTVKNFTAAAAGAEFTLTAAAQTNEITMLQPSVRMLRRDETLTKFGWISVSDAQNGKQYAVTRGNLYGFNLTDDAVWSPAHAYVFSALRDEAPIEISMDHLYAQRAFSTPLQTVIDLNGIAPQQLLQSDELQLRITQISSVPQEERIRLYIDSGDTVVSDISFIFPDLGGTVQPQVSCGLDPSDMRFACDIYFAENAYPAGYLSLSVDRLEYRMEGPWTLLWSPVPMDERQEQDTQTVYYPVIADTYSPAAPAEVPDEVKTVLDFVESETNRLKTPGSWIHESSLTEYALSEEALHSLIPVDQAEQYYTRYISDMWYFVSQDGYIHELFSIIRDPSDGSFLSAKWQKDDSILDLLHGLNAVTENKLNYDFNSYEDFTDIVRSSAVFAGSEPCTLSGRQMKCMYFQQSLSGIPNSPGSQSITFYIDPDDGRISQETIDYDLGALFLTRKLLELQSETSLPDDILALRGSFK